MSARRLLAATLLLAAPAAAAEDGARVFQKCYACHSVTAGETGLSGPNLAGVVGRRAGSLPGFEYSPAMLAAGEKGLVWDAATLDRYLADPLAMVPGTAMAFPGLRRAEEREAVIRYLAGTR